MDLVKTLFEREKKCCMCRGVFSFLILGLLLALIYVVYKAVDIDCNCSLHCDCKGKCLGKKIGIKKYWGNKENNSQENVDQEF